MVSNFFPYNNIIVINPNQLKTLKATGSTLVDQNTASSMKVIPGKSSPYSKQKQGGTAKKPNFTIG